MFYDACLYISLIFFLPNFPYKICKLHIFIHHEKKNCFKRPMYVNSFIFSVFLIMNKFTKKGIDN